MSWRLPGHGDEVRFSNVARSVDWIEATHSGAADTFATFATFGPEQMY